MVNDAFVLVRMGERLFDVNDKLHFFELLRYRCVKVSKSVKLFLKTNAWSNPGIIQPIGPIQPRTDQMKD